MTIPRSLSICPLFLAALLALGPHLPAQQAPQAAAAIAPFPTFDVVAIHENKSASDNMSARWGLDAYVATNITVTSLLMAAYNVREELISGLPGWASSTHFDINAKISDPDAEALKKLTREQRQAMMVTLLADHFHLRAHIEVRTLPVYDLVIAKGGSKLKENNLPPSTIIDGGKTPFSLKPGSFMFSDSGMTAIAIPMSTFVSNLAFRVERNVIDKTGLPGKYDITLKWTPPEREGQPNGLSDNSAPDLFTALQEQLGLKLEPAKGPVETLVVDHVEMPSAN